MNKETRVVNIKLDKYDIYIGRKKPGSDGYFGNPIQLRGDKGSTLENYKEYFLNRVAYDEEFKQRILSLKGKTLGCFCKPRACHGDIIKEWLDAQSGEENEV